MANNPYRLSYSTRLVLTLICCMKIVNVFMFRKTIDGSK